MNLKKKIASVVMAAATALSSVAVTAFTPLTSVTAFAAEADVPGTHAAKLTDGKQVIEQITYDSSEDYANGHNYKDFRFTVSGNGVLKLNLQAHIDKLYIDVIREDSGKSLSNIKDTSVYDAGGYNSNYYDEDYGYYWDSEYSTFSVTQKYDVEKGNYIIRVRRYFDGWYDGYGKAGSGEIKLTCSMEKPARSSGLKLVSSTTNTLSLDWNDVTYGYANGAAYYPTYTIGYKVKGSSAKYTQVNSKYSEVTLKKLKVNTQYDVAVQTNLNGLRSAFTHIYVSTKAPATPAKVGTITKSNITSTGAKLTWAKAKNATRYLVGYKVYGSSAKYTQKWVTNPTITLSGLKAGTKYQVKIMSYNGTKAATAWSNAAIFTTQGQLKLGTPTVQAAATVHWNKVNSAKAYDINYSTNGGKTWTTKSTTATSFKFTGTKGTKITYRVRATAGSVKGAYSAKRVITLP